MIEHLQFIVTVDSSDRVIRDGCIVLEADQIRAVGPTNEILRHHRRDPADTVIDGRWMGATPGFVDAHVHLSETLSRAAFPDRLSTRAWVFHWMMPFHGHMTEADERVSVLISTAEMLRSGTTCFLDMGALTDPGVTIPAIAEVGIRAVTGRHAADVRPENIPSAWSREMVDHQFFPSTAAALEALEACVRDWHGYGDGRIRCWVNLQGKEPCSPELLVGARALAQRLGVGTTYHLSSTLEEAEISKRRYGQTPITRIEEMGGLGPNLVLAHAVAATGSEISLLAQHDTKVAFCPGASLKLAKGATSIGRYPEMIAGGVTVGLGSDGTAASGNLSLMRQMYVVAGLFNDARRDPEAIGAARALRLATIDGARALGWDEQIGSLEPGKKGDFVLFDLRHPEWVPYWDPVQALVWSASPASIAETWVDGRPLYRNGQIQTIADEESLYSEARERAAAIIRRAGLDRGDVPLTTALYE